MEYKIVTPDDSEYPEKLVRRLGKDCPGKLYYHGPLELLNHFCIGIICSDQSSGSILMETNQILFTLREFDMNYIGGWHSIIETEIFRLSLFRKNTTTTLFSAKGLGTETFESYLRDRFFPPLHEFPEESEYFKRAQENELLILSVAEPDETKQLRKNIMERNFLACVLSDIIFIPYGPKGSKTFIQAKRIKELNIPAFTIETEECENLHKIGIPDFNKITIKTFLKENGAKLTSQMNYNKEYKIKNEEQKLSFVKQSEQTKLDFID